MIFSSSQNLFFLIEMVYKTELQFVIVKGGRAYTILRVEACSKVVYILSFLNSIGYNDSLYSESSRSSSGKRKCKQGLEYLRWHDKTTRLNQQPHALNSCCLSASAVTGQPTRNLHSLRDQGNTFKSVCLLQNKCYVLSNVGRRVQPPSY